MIWAALLLFAPVLLVACGGGGDTHSEAPAASAEPAATAAPAEVAGGGSVTGTVSYTGEDPDTVIAMDADPNCVAANDGDVYTETVVGDEGKLGNVFVYVKGAPSRPAPSEPVVLEQKGCTYHPHVFGIQVGEDFVVRNDDQSLHNIHATPSLNDEFNQSQPFQGMEMTKKFDKVEVMVPFKCDVHPWMSAYVGVLDHPFFAVSANDGSFTIDNVPPGTYTIEAWHEKFGTRTAEVTVEDGAAAGVTFDFTP
jgi:plastocyanin